MKNVLDAHSLSKRYGGVQALDAVIFELAEGEIHGLCGENGAGKSTLVKILGGFVAPDTGRITIAGHEVTLGQPVDPALLSIVHQELSIVPHLSVLDNVLLGSDAVGAIYRRGRYRTEVRRHLDAVGLSHVPVDALADTLTLAERQLVEIARGIARGARILLLDEPTATLSDAEIEKVFAVLRGLSRDKGTTVVIISHRLNEIFALTDRVTVLRSGRWIQTTRTQDLTSTELVTAMIGRSVASGQDAAPSSFGDRRLTLSDWRLAGTRPIDLSCHAGEITALVGQLGSGADSFLKSIAGLHGIETGTLDLDGRTIRVASVREAYRQGIAYVSEDRAAKGVFLDATIEINFASQVLDRVAHRSGWLAPSSMRSTAEALARKFTLDPSRLPNDVSTLSGGNQQKVSLGKAVALAPRLLLLNEPTRGVDIGARSEIYGQLRQMARDEGLCILFYSTDFEEVLELADRVITFYRGAIVRDVPRRETSADSILHDILHSQPEALSA